MKLDEIKVGHSYKGKQGNVRRVLNITRGDNRMVYSQNYDWAGRTNNHTLAWFANWAVAEVKKEQP